LDEDLFGLKLQLAELEYIAGSCAAATALAENYLGRVSWQEAMWVPHELGTCSQLPGTGRIETFVDGVVAILITIMVLELKLPGEVFAQGRAGAALAEFGPRLAVYAFPSWSSRSCF
jgi:hypothetical protein